MRTLSLGKKPKGRYIDQNRAAHWDGKNEKGESLPSGLYLYHLKADDVTSTKRMVIIK
jgi:flagellar hook assembly protein FlgD